MIMPFGIGTTSTLSGGWVKCDGSEYDTTGVTGPLFQLIGTIYGSSGPSKFNVPNLTTSTLISKNTIVATTVTSLISSGSTFISISSTSSIVTNLLVEGIASLKHQTVVTGILASTVTISLQTLDVIPAGTVLSFSSATYLTYYIKL
jgi:microcystin-dependent protein